MNQINTETQTRSDEQVRDKRSYLEAFMDVSPPATWPLYTMVLVLLAMVLFLFVEVASEHGANLARVHDLVEMMDWIFVLIAVLPVLYGFIGVAGEYWRRRR